MLQYNQLVPSSKVDTWKWDLRVVLKHWYVNTTLRCVILSQTSADLIYVMAEDLYHTTSNFLVKCS